MARPLTLTAQGIESQVGINHLGHFALTVGLLPALGPTGRVVTVASAVHTRGKASNVLETLTGDPAFLARRYSASAPTNDSKLANVLFTRGLAKRLAPGQSALSVHPGVIGTNLARSMGVLGKVFTFFLRLFAKSPAQGAATSVSPPRPPRLRRAIRHLPGQLRCRDLLTGGTGRRARRAHVGRERAARRRRLTRRAPSPRAPSTRPLRSPRLPQPLESVEQQLEPHLQVVHPVVPPRG